MFQIFYKEVTCIHKHYIVDIFLAVGSARVLHNPLLDLHVGSKEDFGVSARHSCFPWDWRPLGVVLHRLKSF